MVMTAYSANGCAVPNLPAFLRPILFEVCISTIALTRNLRVGLLKYVLGEDVSTCPTTGWPNQLQHGQQELD